MQKPEILKSKTERYLDCNKRIWVVDKGGYK